jgi:hypothetical protein
MKYLKISILAVLALIAWAADWYVISLIVGQTKPFSLLSLVGLITILAIAFTIFFHLANFHRIYASGFDALVYITYLLLMPKNEYVILGGALFTLMLVLFDYRIRSEEKSRQDFSILKIGSASVSLIVYGLLLLLGFNIYYNVQTNLKNNPNLYYEQLATVINKTAPYVINQPQLVEPVTSLAVASAKQWVNRYQQYIPFVFALIITGLLWTFAFLIRWAAIIVSWLLFQFFLSVGFFRLEPVQVEVKKLVI